MAQQFVESHLDLEGGDFVLLEQDVVRLRHEGVVLGARQRAAQHVAQRHIFEA